MITYDADTSHIHAVDVNAFDIYHGKPKGKWSAEDSVEEMRLAQKLQDLLEKRSLAEGIPWVIENSVRRTAIRSLSVEAKQAIFKTIESIHQDSGMNLQSHTRDLKFEFEREFPSNDTLFMVSRGGAVVGYALVSEQREQQNATLYNLYVRQAWTEHGIEELLLDQILKFLMRRGVQSLTAFILLEDQGRLKATDRLIEAGRLSLSSAALDAFIGSREVRVSRTHENTIHEFLDHVQQAHGNISGWDPTPEASIRVGWTLIPQEGAGVPRAEMRMPQDGAMTERQKENTESQRLWEQLFEFRERIKRLNQAPNTELDAAETEFSQVQQLQNQILNAGLPPKGDERAFQRIFSEAQSQLAALRQELDYRRLEQKILPIILFGAAGLVLGALVGHFWSGEKVEMIALGMVTGGALSAAAGYAVMRWRRNKPAARAEMRQPRRSGTIRASSEPRSEMRSGLGGFAVGLAQEALRDPQADHHRQVADAAPGRSFFERLNLFFGQPKRDGLFRTLRKIQMRGLEFIQKLGGVMSVPEFSFFFFGSEMGNFRFFGFFHFLSMLLIQLFFNPGHIAGRDRSYAVMTFKPKNDKQISTRIRLAVNQIAAFTPVTDERVMLARLLYLIGIYLMPANMLDILFIPLKIKYLQNALSVQGYLPTQKMSRVYPSWKLPQNLATGGSNRIADILLFVNNNLILNKQSSRSEMRGTKPTDGLAEALAELEISQQKSAEPALQPDFAEFMQRFFHAKEPNMELMGVDLGAGERWFEIEVGDLLTGHLALHMSGTEEDRVSLFSGAMHKSYLASNDQFLTDRGLHAMDFVSTNQPFPDDHLNFVHMAHQLVSDRGLLYFSSAQDYNKNVTLLLLGYGYHVAWVHFKNGRPWQGTHEDPGGMILATRGNAAGFDVLKELGVPVLYLTEPKARLHAFIEGAARVSRLYQLSVGHIADELEMDPEFVLAALLEFPGINYEPDEKLIRIHPTQPKALSVYLNDDRRLLGDLNIYAGLNREKVLREYLPLVADVSVQAARDLWRVTAQKRSEFEVETEAVIFDGADNADQAIANAMRSKPGDGLAFLLWTLFKVKAQTLGLADNAVATLPYYPALVHDSKHFLHPEKRLRNFFDQKVVQPVHDAISRSEMRMPRDQRRNEPVANKLSHSAESVEWYLKWRDSDSKRRELQIRQASRNAVSDDVYDFSVKGTVRGDTPIPVKHGGRRYEEFLDNSLFPAGLLFKELMRERGDLEKRGALSVDQPMKILDIGMGSRYAMFTLAVQIAQQDESTREQMTKLLARKTFSENDSDVKQFSETLAKRYQFYGVDVYARAFESDDSRAEPLHLAFMKAGVLKPQIGLAEMMPAEWTNQFHYVLAIGVVGHLYDKLRMLEEVHRVLMPNGQAQVTYLDPSWLSFGARASRSNKDEMELTQFLRKIPKGAHSHLQVSDAKPDVLKMSKLPGEPQLIFGYDLMRPSSFIVIADTPETRYMPMSSGLVPSPKPAWWDRAVIQMVRHRRSEMRLQRHENVDSSQQVRSRLGGFAAGRNLFFSSDPGLLNGETSYPDSGIFQNRYGLLDVSLRMDSIMTEIVEPFAEAWRNWQVEKKSHVFRERLGRGRERLFAGKPSTVFKGFPDIRQREVGVILQDGFGFLTRGQQIQNQVNWNSQRTDTRLAPEDIRINRNMGEFLHNNLKDSTAVFWGQSRQTVAFDASRRSEMRAASQQRIWKPSFSSRTSFPDQSAAGTAVRNFLSDSDTSDDHGGWMRSRIMPAVSEAAIFMKSLSWVSIAAFSFWASTNKILSLVPEGSLENDRPAAKSVFSSLNETFSSKINFMRVNLLGFMERDVFGVSSDFSRIMKGGADMILGQLRIFLQDPVERSAGFQKFQNQINHNPRGLVVDPEAGFAVANFRINRNVIVQRRAHKRSENSTSSWVRQSSPGRLSPSQTGAEGAGKTMAPVSDGGGGQSFSPKRAEMRGKGDKITPATWYSRIRPFEKRLYEKLGVRFFRSLPFVLRFHEVSRDSLERDLKKVITHSFALEKDFLFYFFFIAVFANIATVLMAGMVMGISVWVYAVFFNMLVLGFGYAAMMHRYHRAKAEHLLDQIQKRIFAADSLQTLQETEFETPSANTAQAWFAPWMQDREIDSFHVLLNQTVGPFKRLTLSQSSTNTVGIGNVLFRVADGVTAGGREVKVLELSHRYVALAHQGQGLMTLMTLFLLQAYPEAEYFAESHEALDDEQFSRSVQSLNKKGFFASAPVRFEHYPFSLLGWPGHSAPLDREGIRRETAEWMQRSEMRTSSDGIKKPAADLLALRQELEKRIAFSGAGEADRFMAQWVLLQNDLIQAGYQDVDALLLHFAQQLGRPLWKARMTLTGYRADKRSESSAFKLLEEFKKIMLIEKRLPQKLDWASVAWDPVSLDDLAPERFGAAPELADWTSLDPTPAKSLLWESARAELMRLGFPPIKFGKPDELIKQGEEAVTLAIIHPANHNDIVKIREGAKHANTNVLLVLPENVQVGLSSDGREVFGANAAIVFKEDQPYWVPFETPLPIHYLMNAEDKFQERFRTHGIPTAMDPTKADYFNDKALTEAILLQQGIPTPASGVILRPRSGRVAALPQYRQSRFSWDRRFELETFLRDFMIDHQLSEVVLKPVDGSQGYGITFFNWLDFDPAYQKLKELKLKRILAGLRSRDMLIQGRVTPELMLHIPEPDPAQPDAAAEPLALDWNLRVLVSLDDQGQPVVSGIVVRAGYEETAVNISQGSMVMLLEEAAEKLKITQEELEALRQAITETARRTFEALQARARQDGVLKPGENVSDFLGLDLMVAREDGKLVPYVIEVNGSQSGGLWALDSLLAGKYENDESARREQQGAATRDWIRLAARRALIYKQSLREKGIQFSQATLPFNRREYVHEFFLDTDNRTQYGMGRLQWGARALIWIAQLAAMLELLIFKDKTIFLIPSLIYFASGGLLVFGLFYYARAHVWGAFRFAAFFWMSIFSIIRSNRIYAAIQRLSAERRAAQHAQSTATAEAPQAEAAAQDTQTTPARSEMRSGLYDTDDERLDPKVVEKRYLPALEDVPYFQTLMLLHREGYEFSAERHLPFTSIRDAVAHSTDYFALIPNLLYAAFKLKAYRMGMDPQSVDWNWRDDWRRHLETFQAAFESKVAAPALERASESFVAAPVLPTEWDMKDFEKLGLHAWNRGSQAEVKQLGHWSVLIKIFTDDPDSGAKAEVTDASHRLAMQKLGGLVPDFTFIRMKHDTQITFPAGQTEALTVHYPHAMSVHMLEEGNLQEQILRAIERGERQKAEALIRDQLQLVLKIIRRGAIPHDAYFDNFGTLFGFPLLLDLGGLQEKRDGIRHAWVVLNLAGSLDSNQTWLKASAGEDLAKFYRDEAARLGLWGKAALEKTILENYAQDAAVPAFDIAADLEDGIRDGLSRLPSTADQAPPSETWPDFRHHQDFTDLFGMPSLAVEPGVYPFIPDEGQSATEAFLNHSVHFAKQGVAAILTEKESLLRSTPKIRVLSVGPGAGIDTLTAIYQLLHVHQVTSIDMDVIDLDEAAVLNVEENISAMLTNLLGEGAWSEKVDADGTIEFNLGEKGLIRIRRVEEMQEFKDLPVREGYDFVFFNAPSVMTLADFDMPPERTGLMPGRVFFDGIIGKLDGLMNSRGTAVMDIGNDASVVAKTRELLGPVFSIDEQTYAEIPERQRLVITRARSEMRVFLNDAGSQEVLNQLEVLEQALAEKNSDEFWRLAEQLDRQHVTWAVVGDASALEGWQGKRPEVLGRLDRKAVLNHFLGAIPIPALAQKRITHTLEAHMLDIPEGSVNILIARKIKRAGQNYLHVSRSASAGTLAKSLFYYMIYGYMNSVAMTSQFNAIVPLQSSRKNQESVVETLRGGSYSSVQRLTSPNGTSLIVKRADTQKDKGKLRGEAEYIRAMQAEHDPAGAYFPKIYSITDEGGDTVVVMEDVLWPSLSDIFQATNLPGQTGLLPPALSPKNRFGISQQIYRTLTPLFYAHKQSEAPPDFLERFHFQKVEERWADARALSPLLNKLFEASYLEIQSSNGLVKHRPNLKTALNILRRVSRRHPNLFTPPYLSKQAGDLHFGNILMDPFLLLAHGDLDQFKLVDPKWMPEGNDPLYDFAKLMHNYSGHYDLALNLSGGYHFGIRLPESAGSPAQFQETLIEEYSSAERMMAAIHAYEMDVRKFLRSPDPELFPFESQDGHWKYRLHFTHATLMAGLLPYHAAGDAHEQRAGILYERAAELFYELIKKLWQDGWMDDDHELKQKVASLWMTSSGNREGYLQTINDLDSYLSNASRSEMPRGGSRKTSRDGTRRSRSEMRSGGAIAGLEQRKKEIAMLQAQYRAEGRLTNRTQFLRQTDDFKQHLREGGSLDEILSEVFAVFKEAAHTVLGQDATPEQVMAALAIHAGRAIEMEPSEGKTLSIAMAAYLHALTGRGVHIHTFNDLLAARDTQAMAKVLHFLGLSVGVRLDNNQSFLFDPKAYAMREPWRANLKNAPRVQDVYLADITYGVKDAFVFDYLADQTMGELKTMRQRPEAPALVVVDEGDSTFLDEAHYPLILTEEGLNTQLELSSEEYIKIYQTALTLERGTHYTLNRMNQTVALDPSAAPLAMQLLSRAGFDPERLRNFQETGEIENLLKQAVAVTRWNHRDQDYVLHNGQIVLIDELTGRLKIKHVLGNHRHQFVAAKESLNGKQVVFPPLALITGILTYQNYYRKVSGESKLAMITGTMGNDAPEVKKIYGLDYVRIPNHYESRLKTHEPVMYPDRQQKFAAILAKIEEIHAKGNPVLVFVSRIDEARWFEQKLEEETAGGHRPVQATLVDGLNLGEEVTAIARAGQQSQVTIATNVVGRGVNIKIDEAVAALGGLVVILTESQQAKRIDDQLIRRGARQGQPGEVYFFYAKDDPVMARFEGQAQSETYLRETRAQTLAFDDMLEPYRAYFYTARQRLLTELNKKSKTHRLRQLIAVDRPWFDYLNQLEFMKYRTDADSFAQNAHAGFQAVETTLEQVFKAVGIGEKHVPFKKIAAALPQAETVKSAEPSGQEADTLTEQAKRLHAWMFLNRSEMRDSRKSLAEKDIRDLTVPAAVFLDAGELARMRPDEAEKRAGELLALLNQHRHFDIYLEGTDRTPVSAIRAAQFQKLMEEYPERVHQGLLDRAHLAEKRIVIQAALFESASTKLQTQAQMSRLKQDYQIKSEVLALEYTKPGALKAFLALAELSTDAYASAQQNSSLSDTAGLGTAAELVRKISDFYAVLGANGRWQVAESYLADVWGVIQNSIAVQWSA